MKARQSPQNAPANRAPEGLIVRISQNSGIKPSQAMGRQFGIWCTLAVRYALTASANGATTRRRTIVWSFCRARHRGSVVALLAVDPKAPDGLTFSALFDRKRSPSKRVTSIRNEISYRSSCDGDEREETIYSRLWIERREVRDSMAEYTVYRYCDL